MNYITQLQDKVRAAGRQISHGRNELDELIAYLSSPKFQGGVDNDYVYISTDLMPRLIEIRNGLTRREG